MVDQLHNSVANNRRIALVESCFGTSGQPLNVNGRVLVGQGVLKKSCRKRLKPRRFFLFNDILVYGNIIIDQKRYNKQHIIPLEEVKLETLDDDAEDRRNGWLVCARGKSFAVFAATPWERREWMHHTDKCIRDRLASGGKQPANDHAAVWVPDVEAKTCMACGKTHFNAFQRRHHCRKCGMVVCGNCSTKKFKLPAQSNKPLRVCDRCYENLSGMANASVVSSDGQPANKPAPCDLDTSGEDDSEDEDAEKRTENTDIKGNVTPTGSTWALVMDSPAAAGGAEAKGGSDGGMNYIYAAEGKISTHSQVGPLPRISQQ